MVKQQFLLKQVSHNVRNSCSSATFYGSYLDILTINCVSAYACEYILIDMSNVNVIIIEDGDSGSLFSAEYIINNVCYFELLYYDYSTYKCRYSDYQFINVGMVYGNAQFWDCICSSSNSDTVVLYNTVIVIDHLIKTLDDITACSKYSNGEITVSYYNPSNIATVDVDSVKDCGVAAELPTEHQYPPMNRH